MGTGDILVKNTRMEEWKNMRMEKKKMGISRSSVLAASYVSANERFGNAVGFGNEKTKKWILSSEERF